MKVTIVPAQVTTVEDRVAGNLGFLQLVLLALPVFGGSLLFAVLPPSMEVSLYKIVLICLIALISGCLAVRIKGKVVLLWLIILTHYGLRPRLYLFDKNCDSLRKDYPEPKNEVKHAAKTIKDKTSVILPKLLPDERALIYATVDDPMSRLRFETTKKGGLSVHISEIQE